MRILSESIADYIDLNYDIDEFNDLKELDKVKNLVINSLNYSMGVSSFYPKELSYFKNLEECRFINFNITDEVIEYLNNFKLKVLSLDNCICESKKELFVDKLNIENSRINLNKVKVKELLILDNDVIDIGSIDSSNLVDLKLLKCNLMNVKLFEKMKNCKVKIVGCSIDDESIINLENVTYDPNMFEKTM